MPRAYSVDLRERVMRAVADGGTVAEVAQQFSVSVDAIYDWKRRLRDHASLVPASPANAGRHRALSSAHEALLQEHIDGTPDCTIDDLRHWLAETHDLSVGWGTMCRALERIDRPRKKRA